VPPPNIFQRLNDNAHLLTTIAHFADYEAAIMITIVRPLPMLPAVHDSPSGQRAHALPLRAAQPDDLLLVSPVYGVFFRPNALFVNSNPSLSQSTLQLFRQCWGMLGEGVW
jgi:hypothetical protein